MTGRCRYTPSLYFRPIAALLLMLCLLPAYGVGEFDAAIKELNQGNASPLVVRKWAALISEGAPARLGLSADEYAGVVVSLTRKLADVGEPVDAILATALKSLDAAGFRSSPASLQLLDEVALVSERAGQADESISAQRRALSVARELFGDHPSLLPRLNKLERRLAKLPLPEPRAEAAALALQSKAIQEEFGLNEQGQGQVTMGQSTRPRSTDSELVTVHFATNRALLAKDDPARMFGGERARGAPAPSMTFGASVVSVPRRTQIVGLPDGRYWIGEVKRPKYSQAVIVSAKLHGSIDEFLASLRSSVRSSGKQELLVYIHGFGTDWPTALQRTAALSVSLGIDGAPVLLSWPSRGDVLSYVADGNELTAAIARNFGTVLDALLTSSGAERILVVAHSMGARFALSGLEQSTQFKTTSRPVRLVFGSPDVDTDDFQDRAKTLLAGTKKATLYASRDDRALQISRSLNQSSRAGDASSRLNVDGLEVIDTTDVAKEWSFDGLTAHNDFAMSALDDFRAIVWHGMPPEKRCILMAAKDPARPAPWRMGSPGGRCKVETFRFATYAARQMGLQPASALVEKERSKACPTSPDDCKLWTETAAVVNSLKSVK